jgi:hypothetical protein
MISDALHINGLLVVSDIFRDETTTASANRGLGISNIKNA